MSTGDTRFLRLGDIAVALVLLTRVPVPLVVAERGARAAWAWPIAGLCVGGLSAGAAWLAIWLSLPPAVAAGAALAVATIVTGGLHEDGLADVADGFWGGFDPARRLEIMRDSRIGSYGVIALVLSLGLRWAALTTLLAAEVFWPVVAAAAMSRAPMAVVMWAMPFARSDGLGRHVGRPGAATAAAAVLCGVGLGVWLVGAPGLAVGCVLAVVAAGSALVARAKIKGQTGDVLGAVQQVSEIAALAVFSSLV